MKGEVAAAPAFTEKVCLCAIIQEHTQSRDTPRPGGTHTAGVKRVKEREREGSEVTLFGNLSLSRSVCLSHCIWHRSETFDFAFEIPVVAQSALRAM